MTEIFVPRLAIAIHPIIVYEPTLQEPMQRRLNAADHSIAVTELDLHNNRPQRIYVKVKQILVSPHASDKGGYEILDSNQIQIPDGTTTATILLMGGESNVSPATILEQDPEIWKGCHPGAFMEITEWFTTESQLRQLRIEIPFDSTFGNDRDPINPSLSLARFEHLYHEPLVELETEHKLHLNEYSLDFTNGIAIFGLGKI